MFMVRGPHHDRALLWFEKCYIFLKNKLCNFLLIVNDLDAEKGYKMLQIGYSYVTLFSGVSGCIVGSTVCQRTWGRGIAWRALRLVAS